MKVVFYDADADLYVTQQQGEALKNMIASGMEWVEINNSMYAVKSIKKIMADAPVDITTPQLPVGAIELPEEVRERNIERIRQMKRDFLARMKNRRNR